MLGAIRAGDVAAVRLGVRNDIEAAYRVLVSLLDNEADF
jgi:DNA-binding GntR family transcriptional regulator